MSYVSVFLAGAMFTLALWQASERAPRRAVISIALSAFNIAVAFWVWP